ncbi:aldose reductase-related protein 2 isoform X2 [Ctenopharyngodon idella]|uniref:aldose reductase-related protein 2 isoform X2 n=1 Tax=Ctenopharyngodon idella TaxID=7959 RepID=UPI00222FC15E|nr:aldose reductase-related protein 2 isoform X2 [Ctenopharyngodon idella]
MEERAGQPRTIELNDGTCMPLLGLGTWKPEATGPDMCQRAAEAAIAAGYRHIDTAYSYRIETEVGKAIQSKIQQGIIRRQDMFIVSKKMGDELFPEKDGKMLTTNIDYVDVWKGMEALKATGKVKSIGVSNFTIEQLERLLSVAKIPPAVNQVELHPYLVQSDLIDYCKSKNIALTAYSPFGSPGRPSEYQRGDADPRTLLEDPVVGDIAKKHRRTPAQVLLRYHVQQSIVVIPKSMKSHHILENTKIFDFTLDEEDMNALRSLNRGWRACIITQLESHPFYPFK